MNIQCRVVIQLFIMFAAGLCWDPGAAKAVKVPIEPEQENKEYLLDVWTNRFDRHWREMWDGGYNRYRFRLGSNNVREWYLEEELKFASPLGKRLRFLFHHARLIHDSSDQRGYDILELEGRVSRYGYLSVFIKPKFKKAENSLGFVLQGRQKVNQYIRLIVEFPHLVRNFAERHGDTSGKTLTVFTDNPVRIGFDVREPLADQFWLRLTGEIIPAFRTSLEDGATGYRYTTERGQAEEIEGWLEYQHGPEHDLSWQTAVGVSFGYKSHDKGGFAAVKKTVSSNLLPSTGGVRTKGPDLIPAGVGDDFYTLTEPDSIIGWDRRWGYIGPYVWVPLSERLLLKTSLIYFDRSLERRDYTGRLTRIDNVAVVSGAGLQIRPRGGRTYLEAGLAVEYRRRTEKPSRGVPQTESLEDDYKDHRMYIAYEYRFADSKIIRLIETIDFDREDWGAFSLHDHAFVQILFEF